MASLNKVILIGNLGADPEVRAFANGDAVCNLRLATSEQWKDKASGEPRESTEWHRVVLFRRLAEIAGQYLKKGSQVYVEGRLRTRKWQDRDGQECYTTEIEATEMKMLAPKSADANMEPSQEPNRQHQDESSGAGLAAAPKWLDDDIPF